MKPINYKLLSQIFFILIIIVGMILNTYRNIQLHRAVESSEKAYVQLTKTNLTLEMIVTMAYKSDSTALNPFQKEMLKAVIHQDYKRGLDKMFVHKPTPLQEKAK